MPEGKAAAEASYRNGYKNEAARQIGGNRDALAVPLIGAHPTMKRENQGWNAVGEPGYRHTQRPSSGQRKPHQRDIVERIAQLADRCGEEDATEIQAPKQRECADPIPHGFTIVVGDGLEASRPSVGRSAIRDKRSRRERTKGCR
jgi:hypothetical protein